jgi:hypothetical protein
MARCLVSFSEATVALIVSLRRGPDESLEAVVHRALDVLAAAPPSLLPLAPISMLSNDGIIGRRHSVTLFGQTVAVRTKQDVLATVLSALQRRDRGFLARFASERGRTRRFVARSREALYPGSSHLARYARDIGDGWWMATNFSERDVERAITKACAVAGAGYGTDVVIAFDSKQKPCGVDEGRDSLAAADSGGYSGCSIGGSLPARVPRTRGGFIGS